MKELERVARLRAQLAREVPGIRVGIGDDAAVLDAPAFAALVWTVDAQVEGTHFRRAWVSWEDVGWRSFMAAASDLAAMGAEPVAALSALVLTPEITDNDLDAIARGQAAASLEVGAPIAGGNLARGTETSITTTLLGRATSPILRTGARPGDGVWLAGRVGLAAAGLGLLAGNMHDARMARCLEAWRRPRALIAEGKTLASLAHAAIDISDGLAHDAWQLAEASAVCIVLDARAILDTSPELLAVASSRLKRDALDLALHGGEDYALLAASPVALPGFVRIGSVEPSVPEGARLMLASADGSVTVLKPRGFDHFAT